MAKNVERLQASEAKELIRREKQLDARSNKFYMIYLFMILSLIYITDEIASTISIQFQANIVTEFFVKNMGMEYGAGLSLFSAIGFISYPVTLLIIFYRPLADKFVRQILHCMMHWDVFVNRFLTDRKLKTLSSLWKLQN